MRTTEEIYQELAADFQGKTGLSAAGCSDLAVRLYAVAAQLYGLYVQAEWTRRQCFPQTAEGDELDKHAWLRGVSRREAESAVGTVRFFLDGERQNQTVIPAGTVCMTSGGVRFETTHAVTVEAGQTEADVTVKAVQSGAAGNVAANTVVYMAVAPLGSTACTNPEAISGGQDEESDENLRERVLETYRRLANGANSAFYQQTALAFDGVAAVTVLPRNRGVGTVDLIVAAQKGMPDKALLEELANHLASVREIAVDVQVLAPTAQVVDVAVTIVVDETADSAAVVEEVTVILRNWFTGQRLGCPVLRAELTALVFGVNGVSNCAVTLPDEDLILDNRTLPVLGQLTVTTG